MNWVYVCYGLIAVGAIFLWMTALSGTKFYETEMSKKDINGIKLFIHLAFIALFCALSYIVYVGEYYVEEVESQPQTGQIQTGSPETER